MQPRRKVSILTLVVIGVAIGLIIKNVRIGLLVGLGLGLLVSGLISSRK
jgi:mannose/fructose/N-acetylgalactosamine-specific phosphotransferase system component IIC